MSKDIRSFFQVKKVQKVKVEEDDDDIIPESPDVQVKNKKKDARKKRVLSDSDEEIFESKKKKFNIDKSKNKNKSPSQPLKEVKAVDIFGSGRIKRTEPLVKKDKKKKTTETGIHSDDDFDKSLLELDAVEELALKSNDIKSSEKLGTPHKKKVEIDTKMKKTPIKPIDNIKPDQPSISKIDSNATFQSHSKKSKVDNENKRKFAEFIEDKVEIMKDKSHEEETNKKKKVQKNIKSENTHNDEKGLKIEENGDLNDSNAIENSLNESAYEATKKKKNNKSLNDSSLLTDEERHERKTYSAALYKQYLNRSGPKHLGTKVMPEGAPGCLKDCAFLLTGVLDSFDREQITETIINYGGCIKNGISKKVTHVLAGEDAGPAKMAKAQELGIKIMNEDEFLQFIRDSVSRKPKERKVEINKEKTPSDKRDCKRKASKESTNSNRDKSTAITSNKTSPDEKFKETKLSKSIEEGKDKIKTPVKVKSEVIELKKEKNLVTRDTKSQSNMHTDSIVNGNKSGSCESIKPASNSSSMMWVDKYKPQNLKQIIGQHGDASNVKKLCNWLTKWYVNRRAKLPKPSPWAKNDEGGYYKAALLSGPPGVGKTTTVALVCKELGFDVVEFNASDTRSKNLIKEQISELLTSNSLSGYARGDTGKQAVTKKHVLVMDEVDGMAGNEDRGGIQELIGLIKTTSVPIICMCNDRHSQKMRTFVNYCYDLRFSKPRVDQIKSAMMSICFKEGVKVPHDVLSQLIASANQDIRQTLHLLSMWAADPQLADPDRLRKDASTTKKDIKLGQWDAVRKVFSAEDHKHMSLHDRSDLFFYDYSLAPLFVQENYLQVVPHGPKKEILDRVSQAADSISIGDLVDARIRRNQAWSLLPAQAIYSSVLPGQAMRGHVAGQIQFPGWLGKNSRAAKLRRLCQDIHAHTRLSTSGSKSSIFLDYSSHLRDAIITPLIKERSDGIAASMEVLEAYHLLRDDLDSLTELSLWPGQSNPTVLIDSKVKAAMTRTYNKSATALPYAPANVRKGRVNHDGDDDGYDDDDAAPDDDSDPENDALIKKKKKIDKPGPSKEKASTSKGGSSKAKASSTSSIKEKKENNKK